MIGVKLNGGLGNMMFQIAFIESMSKKHGFDVKYCYLYENFDFIKTYPMREYAYEYFSIFKNINWLKNQDEEFERSLTFSPYYAEIDPVDNILYCGYFQSEKYFYDREFIKWLFEFSEKMDSLPGITCSIHIRRGDYLYHPEIHPALDMDYYEEAMSLLPIVDKYYVFSDDLEWCKDRFAGSKFDLVSKKDYEEMQMMSLCTYNIIANSSFSWWGAYLGKQNMVIAPRRYVGTEIINDMMDIIPPNWIKI